MCKPFQPTSFLQIPNDSCVSFLSKNMCIFKWFLIPTSNKPDKSINYNISSPGSMTKNKSTTRFIEQNNTHFANLYLHLAKWFTESLVGGVNSLHRAVVGLYRAVVGRSHLNSIRRGVAELVRFF